MSIDEFFAVLPKDGWCFDTSRGSKAIRNEALHCFDAFPSCPIVSLSANRDLTTNREWEDVAEELGLSKEDARAIAWAADFERGPLRARLLAHCGLTEGQP